MMPMPPVLDPVQPVVWRSWRAAMRLTPAPLLSIPSITLQPALAGQSGIPEVSSGGRKRIKSRRSAVAASPPPSTDARFGTRQSEREEATQTITEECERLFCDALREIFLVERKVPPEGKLVMGVSDKNDDHLDDTGTTSALTEMSAEPVKPPKAVISAARSSKIEAYMEAHDYSLPHTSRFRAFVVPSRDPANRTFFVFFEAAEIFSLPPTSDAACGKHRNTKDLKAALVSLMELAPNFGCGYLVACLDRKIPGPDLDKLIRNFGWAGFKLCTLNPWVRGDGGDGIDGRINRGSGEDALLSERWVTLKVEV